MSDSPGGSEDARSGGPTGGDGGSGSAGVDSAPDDGGGRLGPSRQMTAAEATRHLIDSTRPVEESSSDDTTDSPPPEDMPGPAGRVDSVGGARTSVPDAEPDDSHQDPTDATDVEQHTETDPRPPDRPDLPDRVWEHTLRGGFNRAGQPTGWHHRPDGVDPDGRRIPYDAQRLHDDQTGAYRVTRTEFQDHDGGWVAAGEKDYFPDHWSEDDVRQAVTEAWNDPGGE